VGEHDGRPSDLDQMVGVDGSRRDHPPHTMQAIILSSPSHVPQRALGALPSFHPTRLHEPSCSVSDNMPGGLELPGPLHQQDRG
jgi:hypothetical protein